MKSLWKALRVWWYFRRLKGAWKVIRRTDLLMADKPSWKRKEFWETFIKRHDFRNFSCHKFIRDMIDGR